MLVSEWDRNQTWSTCTPTYHLPRPAVVEPQRQGAAQGGGDSQLCRKGGFMVANLPAIKTADRLRSSMLSWYCTVTWRGLMWQTVTWARLSQFPVTDYTLDICVNSFFFPISYSSFICSPYSLACTAKPGSLVKTWLPDSPGLGNITCPGGNCSVFPQSMKRTVVDLSVCVSSTLWP